MIYFNLSYILRQNAQKNFFFGFEPTKMHCDFTYTTNAFQDESWDLSNFICYEGSLTSRE